MSPEVAVVRLLRWAPDRKAAIQLAIQHAELAGQLLATHNQCVLCCALLWVWECLLCCGTRQLTFTTQSIAHGSGDAVSQGLI